LNDVYFLEDQNLHKFAHMVNMKLIFLNPLLAFQGMTLGDLDKSEKIQVNLLYKCR
jgi:hypothetical protein